MLVGQYSAGDHGRLSLQTGSGKHGSQPKAGDEGLQRHSRGDATN
jgi:hypothetical protein